MVVLIARLRRSGPPGFPHLDRHRGTARDRRRLVQTDGPGLRDERRRLRRREGESGHPAEPRRSGRSAHRLRAHGRRVDSRRHLRGHLARSIAQQSQGRALARVPRGDRPRQPARRSRVRSRVRASDVRLRDRDVRSRRGRSREDDPWTPTARSGAEPDCRRDRRGHALCPPAGVLVGLDRADRRRGDRQRRQRVPEAPRKERGDHARGPRQHRDRALPRRLVPGRAGARAPERDGVGRCRRSRERPSRTARPSGSCTTRCRL